MAMRERLTDMMSAIDDKGIVAFFFGTRWWVVWHAAITLLLLPFVAVVVWVVGFEPGAGSQGEVMAALLLFFVIGEALATFVHAMLFAWTRQDREPGQLLKFVALWAVAFALFTAVLWAVVEWAALAGTGSAGRVAGLLLAIGLVATLHGAGLVVLERFKRWRAGGGVL